MRLAGSEGTLEARLLDGRRCPQVALAVGSPGDRAAGRLPAHEPQDPKELQFPQHFATFMTDSSPRFGFVAFAETWNGRLAMLGFVIGLATELLTGQSILAQIGLG